jgi:hypothetical protein
MSAHELEFRPDPLDAAAIESSIRTDLAAFSQYVEQELGGIGLFGAIVHRLSAERPDETRVETDISSGKVGLQMAAITGTLPERFTNPDTPIVQTVYYPPVGLPDGNHALLSEVAHRRRGIDSEVVARIPMLHIISPEALADFRNGEVDFLPDVSLENYYRYNFDRTGRSEGEAPFSTVHRVFFLHPLGQEATSELEREKQRLLEQQNAYLARLQTIESVVLDEAQED